MRTSIRFLLLAPLISLVAACGGGSDAEDAAANQAAAEQAHTAYVTAINANDLARFNQTITDDIVYLVPNSAALVGKAAVSAWVKDYFVGHAKLKSLMAQATMRALAL